MLFSLLGAALIAALPGQGATAKAPLRYVEKADGNLPANRKGRPLFQDALGAAMARQLGRPVKYVQLPRKRVMAALENGDGDVLCSYLPQWLPGEVEWSKPFLPVSEVVMSSPRVAPLAALDDLRGKTIGTVLGFRYPELEKTLGKDFVRDDAPSTMLSIRKWSAGRFDYVITPRTVVDSFSAEKIIAPGYHLLTVYEVKTMCAISRKSSISVAEFNAAIEALEKNGELTQIMKLR
ncbi:substrate-binding periplasmic protein [Duganella callida]|uniref:Transporter substrate-binding domain-containing protein n=1 Tax=Duganella callida TaxID=2561932 RepID=A0A4Y9S6P3_9BURK|nr:transporter substrate-binding domain-containing protein [Duganella callida]TFW17082.1 transporter substrate-binding domain-containing protein [Duganella callida]